MSGATNEPPRLHADGFNITPDDGRTIPAVEGPAAETVVKTGTNGLEKDVFTTRDSGEDRVTNADSSRSATRLDASEEETAAKVQEKHASDENPHGESTLQRLWKKIDLDVGTLLMMFKASIPPTIGIAIYQADAVAQYFATLGYLVPIITVLSMCILPRAKYLQTLVLNVMGISIGSAVSMLGLWTGIQARINTTPPGSFAAYNSSQSVVCAIWLFANIWLVNTLRAKIPALQFPVIVYSIFTNVAFTFGPQFPTVPVAEAFIKQLLTGFLTAFGLATAVSLFVIPVSSRTILFKEMNGYVGALRATIHAQTAYLQSLEHSDMFAAADAVNEVSNAQVNHRNPREKNKSSSVGQKPAREPASSETLALKAAIGSLAALHGKIHGDIAFAKREVAWGKLRAKDLDQIFQLLRTVFVPLIGMSTIHDIFERIAQRRGWLHSNRDDGVMYKDAREWEHDPLAREEERRLWNEVMQQLHEPFAVVSAAMDDALEHVLLLLEFKARPKGARATESQSDAGPDVEARGDLRKPGDESYGEVLREKMADFYNSRGKTLKFWAKVKGLSAGDFDTATAQSPGITPEGVAGPQASHLRDRQQLYLILYMEFLLYSAGMAIDELVKFAESKVADKTMQKNRLILPGQRRIWKWIKNIGSEDSTLSEATPDSMESGQNTIYMGSGYQERRDAEHLPAVTAWQRFGNQVRKVPRFLRSNESTFGFRVACATMTVGVVAYLEKTQGFFIEQRFVWAMIIIAIGMTITSGQSVFGFFARIGGTAISMVSSLVIWYIVDQTVPGIIVMLWFFIFIEFYFFLKFPRLIPVWIIAIVTQVLIIGYELQVEKIGVARATASGQPYYPIYELAPYRLACVAGGSFVAFIWTIFPYPLTDRNWLRRDLGATMYLLANYYSVVHSTIHARLHGIEGEMEDKLSPGRQLQKMRHKIWNKILLLLPQLRQHADWQKWEPTIGGEFPEASYNTIITKMTSITQYISLMSYATNTWSSTTSQQYPNADPAVRRVWLNDVARLLQTVGPTSHHITSVLTIISSAVTEGRALPPHIQMPEPYQLSQRLEELDKGILDSRHIEEPGYSAYAVMQVASSLVVDDLRILVEEVKNLVGETDFSFKVVESSSDVNVSSTTDGGKGKRD